MAKAGWLWLPIVVAACDPENPCDRYVSYMCDCHPEVDCGDLTTTYSEPDPSVQDECAIQQDQQEELDAQQGLTCGASTPGATAG